DSGDAGGLSGRQHDDVVAGAHHTAGDRARVAAVVLMITSLRPDDVLHGEPDVDQVTVGGDVDLFEVRQQRRALVPRGVVGLGDHVVAVQRRHRDGEHILDVQAGGEGVELV